MPEWRSDDPRLPYHRKADFKRAVFIVWGPPSKDHRTSFSPAPSTYQ